MDKWFQFISNTISHINIATSEELKIKTYRSYTLLYGLSKHVIYNCGILRIYFHSILALCNSLMYACV